jgi:hypothetical protein
MALASSVTSGPARSRASASGPRRNICGVCACQTPWRESVACDPARLFPLQGVGDRPGEQAADRVVLAGIDERVDPGGADEAACGIVNEHPIARRRTAARQLAEPGADGRGAGRATAGGDLDPLIGGGADAISEVSSSGATTIRMVLRRGTWVRAARAWATSGRPATSTYCFATWPPARNPAPAQGTRARKRGGAGGSAGIEGASGGRKHTGRSGAGRGRQLKSTVSTARHGTPAASMLLPDISPGKRFALPRPTGSADALLLARFAAKERSKGHALAVFSAEPADAQRLADELGFFAPMLRVAVFPDWETLPYDSFSPHQDLISERLATLWRIRGGDVDVLLMPATTALVRLAPPSFIAGYTFHFKTRQRLDEAALRGSSRWPATRT